MDLPFQYTALQGSGLMCLFLMFLKGPGCKSAFHRVHYLTHLMVEREESSSTAVHVVFNASAHDRRSPSLNDTLESGPNTQEDLLRLNLKLWFHLIVVMADVKKAFLQIELENEDRELVRCLWVEDPHSEKPKVVHYRYKRVIFGLRPSPYLLGATFHLHLKKYHPSPAVEALK